MKNVVLTVINAQLGTFARKTKDGIKNDGALLVRTQPHAEALPTGIMILSAKQAADFAASAGLALDELPLAAPQAQLHLTLVERKKGETYEYKDENGKVKTAKYDKDWTAITSRSLALDFAARMALLKMRKEEKAANRGTFAPANVGAFEAPEMA